MKKLVLLLCAAVPAVLAQDNKNHKDAPAWAAEWRVTGIIRQGQSAQASMERSGLRSRFVKEGDHLPGDIDVVQVNYAERSVTVSDGKETTVIYAANAMIPPPPPPKVTGVAQQQPQGGSQNQGRWPNPPSQPTAMRDCNGRWHVVFSNGRSMDMQGYVERHGGIQATIEHVKEHVQREDNSNPERAQFHQQQLRALQAMQKSGMQ